MTLFFVELHEEDPVRIAATDLGVEVRMERFVGYFLTKFKESSTFVGSALTYVLFPDFGAYGRYMGYVVEKLGLDLDHILWINKKRVGGTITQENGLHFKDKHGVTGEKASFASQEYVLVIDDFTNSGSTLFG